MCLLSPPIVFAYGVVGFTVYDTRTNETYYARAYTEYKPVWTWMFSPQRGGKKNKNN